MGGLWGLWGPMLLCVVWGYVGCGAALCLCGMA